MSRVARGVALLGLVACQTSGPIEPLWPDRSAAVASAREVAQTGHVPGAANASPDGPRIGFAPMSDEDPLAAAWASAQGVGGPGEPVLLAALTADSEGLVAAGEGRSLSGSSASDESVLRLVGRGSLECSRASGAAFLQAALQEVPVVAVAELPVPEDRQRPVALRRRAGLDAESISTMKTRRFAVMSDDPLVRASAVQWLRSTGLAAVVPRMTTVAQARALTEVLSDGEADYVFHRVEDTTRIPGTPVALRPEVFPSPKLAVSLLVCRTEALATHRRALTALLARWARLHPEYAPSAVDEERLLDLNGLLLSTGVVRSSAPGVLLVDGSLAREASKRLPR